MVPHSNLASETDFISWMAISGIPTKPFARSIMTGEPTTSGRQ